MKKEKKEILKNSEYYYKKSGKVFASTFCTLVAIGIVSATIYGICVSYYFDKKYNDLREKSGYNEVIQDDLLMLKEKYENEEISYDYYNAAKNNLLHNEFKGFLKTNNPTKLTEYNQIQKSLGNSIIIFIGSIFTFATASVIGSSVYEHSLIKKYKQLKEQEESQESTSTKIDKADITIQYCLENESNIVID